MADIYTQGTSLKMGFQRSDTSIQYVTVPEAYSGLSESEVRNVMNYLTTNSILLDSKTEMPFSETSILTAYVDNVLTVTLDLS